MDFKLNLPSSDINPECNMIGIEATSFEKYSFPSSSRRFKDNSAMLAADKISKQTYQINSEKKKNLLDFQKQTKQRLYQHAQESKKKNYPKHSLSKNIDQILHYQLDPDISKKNFLENNHREAHSIYNMARNSLLSFCDNQDGIVPYPYSDQEVKNQFYPLKNNTQSIESKKYTNLPFWERTLNTPNGNQQHLSPNEEDQVIEKIRRFYHQKERAMSRAHSLAVHQKLHKKMDKD